jgi:molecular chaperone DnaJ
MVNKKVAVKIPAGVNTGSKLRLTGEGEAGIYGGLPGDLYVFISVEAHKFFERRNTDTITIPTLNSEKKLEIPKGTQPGDLFRFRKEGIPSLQNGRRGDQIVQVSVKTPTGLNKKQEMLLKEFAKIESGKLSHKLKNIFKNGSLKEST